MAKYDKALADFVKQYGEDSVETAFRAFINAKSRSKAYADGRKVKNKALSVLFEKAKDPAVAAKLRELGINLG